VSEKNSWPGMARPAQARSSGHNNLAMNRGVLQVAQHFIKDGHITNGTLNRLVAVIRAFDLPLSAQPSTVGSHYTTPEELAALTAAVYGRCPPIVVVSMTGANFSIGEHLSSIVARRIPLMSVAVLRVCSNVL